MAAKAFMIVVGLRINGLENSIRNGYATPVEVRHSFEREVESVVAKFAGTDSIALRAHVSKCLQSSPRLKKLLST